MELSYLREKETEGQTVISTLCVLYVLCSISTYELSA